MPEGRGESLMQKVAQCVVLIGGSCPRGKGQLEITTEEQGELYTSKDIKQP